MCVIICLKKGQTIPFKEFSCALHNNDDGFGMLVTKDDGLHLTKKLIPDEEGIDKVLWDEINAEIDYDRVVHLRNATVGSVSEENLQPVVFEIGEKKFYMFHNGTMHKYKPTSSENTNTQSDTVLFTQNFLIPLLSIVDNEGVKSDFNHPFVKKWIESEWTVAGNYQNRGLLICDSIHPGLILNEKEWSRKIFSNGETILVSNETYFNQITRGRFFLREEKKRKEAEEKARANTASNTKSNIIVYDNTNAFQKLKDVRLREATTSPTISVGQAIKEIVGEDKVEIEFENIYDDYEALVSMLALTEEEFFMFTDSHPDIAAHFIMYLISEIDSLSFALGREEEKHQKASAMIERLMAEKQAWGRGNVG